MRIDKSEFLDIFAQCASIFSPPGEEKEMASFIIEFLRRKTSFKIKQDKKGNLYVESPFLKKGGNITLNAHLDAFSNSEPNTFSHNISSSKVTSEGSILGVDDKVGIAIILYLASKTGLLFKAVFTVEEENGCVGAQQIDGDFLRNERICISLDRKNSGDIIQVYGDKKMCSDETVLSLQKVAKKTGLNLSVCPGSFGDAYYISRFCEAINLSVGYYGAKRVDDYFMLDETVKTIEFLRLLLEEGLY